MQGAFVEEQRSALENLALALDRDASLEDSTEDAFVGQDDAQVVRAGKDAVFLDDAIALGLPPTGTQSWTDVVDSLGQAPAWIGYVPLGGVWSDLGLDAAGAAPPAVGAPFAAFWLLMRTEEDPNGAGALDGSYDLEALWTLYY